MYIVYISLNITKYPLLKWNVLGVLTCEISKKAFWLHTGNNIYHLFQSRRRHSIATISWVRSYDLWYPYVYVCIYSGRFGREGI